MPVPKDGLFAKISYVISHPVTLLLFTFLLLAATYNSWRTQFETEERRKNLKKQRKSDLGEKKDIDSLLDEMMTKNGQRPPGVGTASSRSEPSKGAQVNGGSGGDAAGGGGGVKQGKGAEGSGKQGEAPQGGGGGDGDGQLPRLRWTQSPDEVEIAFRVGEEIVKADVNVTVTKSKLSLKVKEEVIIAGDLWANVDSDVCNWQFSKKGPAREIVIQLEKCEQTAWRGLLKDGPTVG